MKLLAAILMVTMVGCGVEQKPPVVKKTEGGLTCDKTGEVPIYKNRFQPFSGGSGVTSGADAMAGKISADAPAGAPTAPPIEVSSTEPFTAMSESCGAVPTCVPGQVAVEELPRASSGGAGGFGAGIDAPAEPAPAPPPAPTTTVKLVCAEPPPTCPKGQTPQFTSKRVWECTDCGLVVTFGGIFGNYRRCVDKPTITCGTGEVPTFGLEDETWQCKPTCDNGMYDQHTVDGVMVCVPC